MATSSIVAMNHSDKYRNEPETTPAQALRIAHNDETINDYKAVFGGKAAIELSLNFKIVDELIVEMGRQVKVHRLHLEMDDPATKQARLMDICAELHGLGADIVGPGDGREDELLEMYAHGREVFADARRRGSGL